MTKINISVPLFAPSFKRLKADAVWVTIANWAEGLEDKYGKAEVIAGEVAYSSNQIRSRCFPNGTHRKQKPSGFRKSLLVKLLETFIKDIRWFLEDSKNLNIAINKFKNSPFIWQHHDLFQTRGLQIAKKLGVPSVLFVDAPYVWESKKWGVPRLGWEWFAVRRGDSFPCKKADLVLVVSEEVRQAVLELGVDKSKVLITPCTVSIKRFNNTDGLEVRRSLGLNESFVIGWVGSFRKFHSLDLLIKSFNEVAASVPKAKLLLVGDGPERIQIQNKVHDLGLNDRVIFTGNVPHNEVNGYISTFDLAVIPSESNHAFHYSPLKLREFFAAGVPVIASAVGDVKNVIKESDGGWLVKPGCKYAIAEMIIRIESDRKKLTSAGSNAKSYAVNEMGIANQIRMIEEFFNIT